MQSQRRRHQSVDRFGQEKRPVPAQRIAVTSRNLEIVFIAVMVLAVFVGGRSLLVGLAAFHGVAISALGAIGIFLIYAFRRSFRAGGPLVRIHAARDTAFLAAIAGAIAFILVPQRWSLGAATVALEIGLVVELLARVVEPNSPKS